VKNNKYFEEDSIYCYPSSNVLINKFNITDPEAFERKEHEIVSIRLSELISTKTSHTNSSDYLKHIHYYLFQDLYSWAGKIRTVKLGIGNISFAHPIFIEQELQKEFDSFQKKNVLSFASKVEFSQVLAKHKIELNIIHPFRDGNGRSIRTLIESIANDAGFFLQFNLMNYNEYLNAMVKSPYDSTLLENLILTNLL
jgi:cell filamentation protein